MEKPLYLQREKKRTIKKVKVDIEATNKILREDIYDLLKAYYDSGKTKEEAKTELRKFLSELLSVAIIHDKSKEKGIERVIDDIDSYGLKWEK